ncbi:MAG: gliding motility-associated C-terminal domain-containing protein, partial [Cyclobacteriaceae bacterium]|nr:gliding motility-associated C-terminal domain-containing protein [Cyclobacteriaceae bacterium]
GLTTSSIVGLDEGLYEVVAEDQSGCTANATLQINRIPLTPTNLSSAPVFCPDDGSITLDAGSNFVSYLWSDGSTNQTLEVVSGGLYSIEATNNFGCVTNDQSEVIEDCIPKVSGPNAFRPGGLNNTYSLFTQYVDTFEIFIFDQWGEMVYHSDDKAFAWDGVYNNELLPAGQYSWVVRYTSSFRDRGTIEEYGGVVLLR